MPGHYGDKKKKRPSKPRTGSFPTPPKPKPPKLPKARTGSFPMRPNPPKRKATKPAAEMRAATMALLKKKKRR